MEKCFITGNFKVPRPTQAPYSRHIPAVFLFPDLIVIHITGNTATLMACRTKTSFHLPLIFSSLTFTWFFLAMTSSCRIIDVPSFPWIPFQISSWSSIILTGSSSEMTNASTNELNFLLTTFKAFRMSRILYHIFKTFPDQSAIFNSSISSTEMTITQSNLWQNSLRANFATAYNTYDTVTSIFIKTHKLCTTKSVIVN